MYSNFWLIFGVQRLFSSGPGGLETPGTFWISPSQEGRQCGGSVGDLPFQNGPLNHAQPRLCLTVPQSQEHASSTKMGKAVLDLQNKLPLARVVYASATGEGPLIDG